MLKMLKNLLKIAILIASSTIAVSFAAPTFSSANNFSVAENTTFVGAVTTTSAASYAISAGADASLFAINTAGNLTFKTEPDYETPASSAVSNVYNITITATDTNDNSTETQAIVITVIDEVPTAAPVFLASYVITSTINQAVNYKLLNLGGGDIIDCDLDDPLQLFPTGLSIAPSANAQNCEISGIPTTAVNKQAFTLRARNQASIGPTNSTIQISVNAATFSLDVDNNVKHSASNDGLIIFKYLLNPNSNNLHTTAANGATNGRKTTTELKTYLDDARTILDVDGNGTLSASNDGLIIFKYLLNSNANNLHTTIANGATRKTTAQLRAYLDKYE